jgi:HlyD family secretion protein
MPWVASVARRAPYVTCVTLAAVTAFSCSGLVSCAVKRDEKPAPTMTVQVATVQRETIERLVTSEATLYPLRQAAIVPKISAPVSKFYVQRGDHVRAGQVLAELESRDLAAVVTENQGAYEQAQANYRTAIRSGLPEEMQKAELDLQAARKALEAEQSIFNNRQSLFQQGAIPRRDLDDAALALTQARNQFEIAQKHSDSLRSFGSQDAQKAAAGELQAAKGRYDAAQAQLEYAQVRSPIDGVVTDRPLYTGEMATAGSPMITIMDLSRVVARAHIAQQEAALLKVGDQATLVVAGSGEEVPATVTLVSPALDANSTTVEVWADAANPRGRLRPGSSAGVTFVAEKVPDALVIPVGALITGADGSTSVILAGADDKPRPQAVKTGIRQDDRVQVVAGLQAGESVVTQGAYEIAQEDPDLQAKTKLLIVTPKASNDGGDQDSGTDADSGKK